MQLKYKAYFQILLPMLLVSLLCREKPSEIQIGRLIYAVDKSSISVRFQKWNELPTYENGIKCGFRAFYDSCYSLEADYRNYSDTTPIFKEDPSLRRKNLAWDCPQHMRCTFILEEDISEGGWTIIIPVYDNEGERERLTFGIACTSSDLFVSVPESVRNFVMTELSKVRLRHVMETGRAPRGNIRPQVKAGDLNR